MYQMELGGVLRKQLGFGCFNKMVIILGVHKNGKDSTDKVAFIQAVLI